MKRRDAYPLAWPDGWPRTERRKSSQFKTTLYKAIENVQDSLRRFATDSGRKIGGVLISSNVTLTTRSPEDPGVALYFTWDDLPTCIAVDRYPTCAENLQAIHHCLEAERTKLRHGGLNLVRAAFRGYAMLPPPGASEDWREVLGVTGSPGLAQIDEAWKRLRTKLHPDKPGGDAAAFARAKQAYDRARAELMLET